MPKTKRNFNICIDLKLMEKVDELTKEENRSRSNLFETAMIHYLKARK